MFQSSSVSVEDVDASVLVAGGDVPSVRGLYNQRLISNRTERVTYDVDCQAEAAFGLKLH